MIKKTSRKEKLESVFQMVFYGEFSSRPENQFVKQLFEDENE